MDLDWVEVDLNVALDDEEGFDGVPTENCDSRRVREVIDLNIPSVVESHEEEVVGEGGMEDGAGLDNMEAMLGGEEEGDGPSFISRMLDGLDLNVGLDGDEAEGEGSAGESAPRVGMEFETVEEFMEKIHNYALSEGFEASCRSIDLPRGKKSIIRPPKAGGKRTDYIEHNRCRMVCKKWGKFESLAAEPQTCTQSCKTGCLWGVNANRLLNGDGFWRITKVSPHHNHTNEARNARFWARYRSIGPVDSKVAIEMTKSGIPVPQIYNFFVQKYKAFDKVPFTDNDLRNYIHRNFWQPMKTGDFIAMEVLFKKMKEESPNFVYEYDVDDNGRLKNVFWADGRCIEAFREFGDVVSFDTTFITNRYKLPFAPFIVVNHNGKSLLVGCALIGKEDTETFVWLFEVWRKCMGKDPKCILTDQETSIGNAIKIVFPDTRHRLCIWHIKRNAKKHLGSFSAWREISQELEDMLHDSFTVEEFERRWEEWVEKFGLDRVDWVGEMFGRREEWVPVYFKHEFWAGMSSTQRSEGMNSYFKGYVNINTTLNLFCEKYGMAVCKRIEEEEQDCFKAVNRRSRINQHHPFEHVFELLYTRSKFVEFREEVMDMSYNSGTLKSEDGSRAVYEVLVKLFRKAYTRKTVFTVTYDRVTNLVSCDCKNFEFKGILCAHALRVFWCENILKVPGEYVLPRWRRDIPRPYLKQEYPIKALLGRQSIWLERYNALNNVCEEICVSLMNKEEAYKEALRCMRKLKTKLDDKYALPEGISEEGVPGDGHFFARKSRSSENDDGKGKQRIWEEDDVDVVKDPVDKRGRGKGQRKRKKGVADLPAKGPYQHNYPGNQPPNYAAGHPYGGFSFGGQNQPPLWQHGYAAGNSFASGQGFNFNAGYQMNSGTTHVPLYHQPLYRS